MYICRVRVQVKVLQVFRWRVYGLGFRAQGSRFKVTIWLSVFKVKSIYRLWVYGSWLLYKCLGFRAKFSEFRD
jgi:hypothetical protein